MTSTHSLRLEDVNPETPPGCNEQEVCCRPTSSEVSALHRKSKRTSTSRPKTTFQLAHPPPAIKQRQRLRIRPKILLQLQRTSNTARPTPAFDVLPSATIASRLARGFPQTLRGKAGLGVDDLIIVRSEDYHTADTEGTELDNLCEDDSWNTREIVAAICQPGKDELSRTGNPEIILNQGPSWAASVLSNGAYEFESLDEWGSRTIARWVPRRTGSQNQYSQTDRATGKTEENSFKFSILNPDSRRHAIIGTLDSDTIEVSDRYSVPPPITPLQRSATDSNNAATINDGDCFDSQGEKTLLDVDESLRTLIVATGVWVAFREGFFRGPSHSESTALQPRTWRPLPTHKRRSLSLNMKSLDRSISRPSESPTSSQIPHESATVLHTASNSFVPVPSSTNQLHMPHRRAESTGSAFMQRIKSRNFSISKSSRLTPISSFGGSDVEEDSDQRRRTSLAHSFVHALPEPNSPLQPRFQDSGEHYGLPVTSLAAEHSRRLRSPTASIAD